MSKISEFFGLNCKDESLDFEAAMNTQICPYTQRVCTKMRKSDPDIKIGTCSVQYQHQDVIICPYRLLEHEQYGANKVVQDKEANQDILVIEVGKKLDHYPTILLAGHFCIFDSLNNVDKLPYSVFQKIALDQILLLEAEPSRILSNLSLRDNKKYRLEHIRLLLKAERQMAQEVAKQCGCSLHIHQMSFDNSDLQKCMHTLALEGASL